MADLLVDTDVFVDHLRGARRFRPGVDAIHYSVVTRAELLAGSTGKERHVALLLAPFREFPVDRAVAERAGRLRRDSRLMMADALIAATALEHGCALVTRNRRHFGRVAGLSLLAPTD